MMWIGRVSVGALCGLLLAVLAWSGPAAASNGGRSNSHQSSVVDPDEFEIASEGQVRVNVDDPMGRDDIRRETCLVAAFDGTKLIGEGGRQLSGPGEVDISKLIRNGTYDLVLSSFDASHPRAATQPEEQWFIEGLDNNYNVVFSTESQPTVDLPDDQVLNTSTVHAVNIGAATIIRARIFSPSGKPTSVVPLEVKFQSAACSLAGSADACPVIDLGSRRLVGRSDGLNESPHSPFTAPEGSYRTVLVSRDLSHGEGAPSQANEQWELEALDDAGSVLFRTGPVDDLDDDAVFGSTDVGIFDYSNVDTVRARHSFVGLDEPNSIEAVRVVLVDGNCDTSPEIRVTFDEERLTGPRPLGKPIERSVPSGVYEIFLESADQTHNGSQPAQDGEQWFIEGLNEKGEVIYVSDLTPDLDDSDVGEVFSLGQDYVPELAGIRARHGVPGAEPNSVVAVGVTLVAKPCFDSGCGSGDTPGPLEVAVVYAAFVCDGSTGTVAVVNGLAAGETIEVVASGELVGQFTADQTGSAAIRWSCSGERAWPTFMVRSLDSESSVMFSVPIDSPPPSAPELIVDLGGAGQFECRGLDAAVSRIASVSGFATNERVLVTWAGGSTIRPADASGQRTLNWRCEAGDVIRFVVTGLETGRSTSFEVETAGMRRSNPTTPRPKLLSRSATEIVLTWAPSTSTSDDIMYEVFDAGTLLGSVSENLFRIEQPEQLRLYQLSVRAVSGGGGGFSGTSFVLPVLAPILQPPLAEARALEIVRTTTDIAESFPPELRLCMGSIAFEKGVDTSVRRGARRPEVETEIVVNLGDEYCQLAQDRLSADKLAVIDPGHGFFFRGGSLQPQRIRPPYVPEEVFVLEDEVVLDVSQRAAELLDSSEAYDAVLTRDNQFAPFAPENCNQPCGPDLEGRAELAERLGADVLLSVHTNGFDGSAHGVEALAWAAEIGTPEYNIADAAIRGIESLGVSRRTRGGFGNGIVRDQVTRVICGASGCASDAAYPAVLVEVAFHDNVFLADDQTVTDNERLRDPQFLEDVARVLSSSISGDEPPGQLSLTAQVIPLDLLFQNSDAVAVTVSNDGGAVVDELTLESQFFAAGRLDSIIVGRDECEIDRSENIPDRISFRVVCDGLSIAPGDTFSILVEFRNRDVPYDARFDLSVDDRLTASQTVEIPAGLSLTAEVFSAPFVRNSDFVSVIVSNDGGVIADDLTLESQFFQQGRLESIIFDGDECEIDRSENVPDRVSFRVLCDGLRIEPGESFSAVVRFRNRDAPYNARFEVSAGSRLIDEQVVTIDAES